MRKHYYPVTLDGTAVRAVDMFDDSLTHDCTHDKDNDSGGVDMTKVSRAESAHTYISVHSHRRPCMRDSHSTFPSSSSSFNESAHAYMQPYHLDAHVMTQNDAIPPAVKCESCIR